MGEGVWRYVPLMLQKSGATSEDDHMEHENPGRLTAGSPENTGPPRSSENHRLQTLIFRFQPLILGECNHGGLVQNHVPF